MGQLQHDLDRSKRDYLEIKMAANEEVILLRQQVVALRKALSTSEKEREATKKTLDKEVDIVSFITFLFEFEILPLSLWY